MDSDASSYLTPVGEVLHDLLVVFRSPEGWLGFVAVVAALVLIIHGPPWARKKEK